MDRDGGDARWMVVGEDIPTGAEAALVIDCLERELFRDIDASVDRADDRAPLVFLLFCDKTGVAGDSDSDNSSTSRFFPRLLDLRGETGDSCSLSYFVCPLPRLGPDELDRPLIVPLSLAQPLSSGEGSGLIGTTWTVLRFVDRFFRR